MRFKSNEIENFSDDQRFRIWRAYRVEKNKRGEEEFAYIEGTAPLARPNAKIILRGSTSDKPA